jgi:prepilin signal peptidase PulO-like enzyme (type II secretory pathway)
MIIVFLCGLGLIFGSFVNALVWRLAKQEGLDAGEPTPKKPKAKTSAKKSVATTDYSITTGRSMCPQCHHTLAAKDLVPVLSWLSLRGKCRYCGQPISRQYPLVELLTGLLFMVFYLGWPFSLSGLHLVQFVYGLIYIVFFCSACCVRCALVLAARQACFFAYRPCGDAGKPNCCMDW